MSTLATRAGDTRDFPLSVADLVSRTWQFGPRDGGTYASHLKLLANGRIGGHPIETESRWRLEEGRLVFLDSQDRRLTVFNRVSHTADRRLVLDGAFRGGPPEGGFHRLLEIEPLARPAPAATDLKLICRSARSPLRRNLVVLRAGERSLHPQWPQNIAPEDRTWDFCNSWYGPEELFGSDPVAEYQVRQIGLKYPPIYELFHEGSRLWDYDYVALLDDDLMLSWRDINLMFAYCKRYDLLLAQPSLAKEGYIAHKITQTNELYRLRYTSFVETMTPIFSREALLACVATFPGTLSGFGLDNVWPKLIGEPLNRIAVIDAVSILHTRPTGANYDLQGAVAESLTFQDRYGAPSRVLEFGGILRDPVSRSRFQ